MEGQVAIVTGAGGGIGKATATLLAKEGASVVCADLNGATAAAVASEINGLMGSDTAALGIEVDVAQPAAVQSMVETCESTYGRLDVLFNNAGLMHPEDDDAVTTEEKIWDLTMNVNVKGVWFGCKYAIPVMRKSMPNQSSIFPVSCAFGWLLGRADVL